MSAFHNSVPFESGLVRILCAVICAAFLPLSTSAAALEEHSYWRNCSKDAQCVLIDGTCFPTAVNVAAKSDAAAYYRQQAAAAKCTPRFWQPKEVMPRCWLGACSTAAKAAKTDENK